MVYYLKSIRVSACNRTKAQASMMLVTVIQMKDDVNMKDCADTQVDLAIIKISPTTGIKIVGLEELGL